MQNMKTTMKMMTTENDDHDDDHGKICELTNWGPKTSKLKADRNHQEIRTHIRLQFPDFGVHGKREMQFFLYIVQ